MLKSNVKVQIFNKNGILSHFKVPFSFYFWNLNFRKHQITRTNFRSLKLKLTCFSSFQTKVAASMDFKSSFKEILPKMFFQSNEKWKLLKWHDIGQMTKRYITPPHQLGLITIATKDAMTTNRWINLTFLYLLHLHL